MKNSRWWLLFTIFLILTILIIYFKRKHPLECKTEIDLQQLENLLETGDLILFSGTTLGENAIKTYTLSDFSHISLVIKSEEDHKPVVWLWESDIGQHIKDGPRAIILEDKLKKWKGNPYIRVCKTGLKIDPIKFEKVIKEVLPQKMDYDMKSWLLGSSYKPQGTWFCSELVVHTLSETTNWKPSSDAFRYSPKRLVLEMVENLGATYKDFEPKGGTW